MAKYKFEYADMKFSKNGQLDELIALDRYTIQSFDNYQIGDTVVFTFYNEDKGIDEKRIGKITKVNGDLITVKDRFEQKHEINKENMHKPLETEPHQLWDRWAKGGASVEKNQKLREWFENELRWLFDGYRYSMGGRIQLMLGQEHVTGERANLTAYNCFVLDLPKGKSKSLDQFLEVLRVAKQEIDIQRRGGGTGITISEIQTVNGANIDSQFINIIIPEDHKDFEELQERMSIGKFDGVTVNAPKLENEKTYNIEDSTNGLYQDLKNMVVDAYDAIGINQINLDFSNIRHRNAIVRGVNGRSSGAVSWAELYVLVARLLQQETINNVELAEIFSAITHLIEQGGSRRGALMLINAAENENAEFFIKRKKELGYLSGANISVDLSDTFMQKVKDKSEDELKLWDMIIEYAWKSAEPGVVFLERYNKESNSWYYNPIVSTNPCGEQGLPEMGVCNLGHFVLPRFYDKQNDDVNWNDLARAIKTAVRLQDNIIDYTQYFLKENEDVQKQERRVGIGSMGLGTLMIKLGLRYGSTNGNKFVDKLYRFIAVEAYKASIDLAEEKGKFPKCEPEKMAQSGFMQRLLPELPQEYQDKFFKTGIRNVTLLTQAPTGSTSTYIDNIPMFREVFGGTTGGIEPYFSWEYFRASRLGVSKQTVGIAEDYLKANNLKSVKDLPNYYVTAMELSPQDHVDVQAAVQKWTDSSISKTANCPSDFSVEETSELYMSGYDKGLKGLTIYRDSSRDAQVLATNEEDAKLETHIEKRQAKQNKEAEKTVAFDNLSEVSLNNSIIQKRPKRLHGFTDKIRFMFGDKQGKAYVTINMKDDEVWEVFITTKEKEVSAMAKALGLMTTKMLRLGAASDNLQQVIDTLSYDQIFGTLPHQLAQILKDIQKENIKKEQEETGEVKLQKCPECGATAYDKANCICHSCGMSNCN